MRREPAGFLDGQLRAVPERTLLVAHQQHAELVHAEDDLLHHQALLGLLLPAAAGELVHRHHRGVAGMVGVVHGRPVDHGVAVAQRQVVRHRDRLVVRDQEAVERTVVGRPGAHARAGAGLVQVDRRAAAVGVAHAALGEVTLVRAPAELGRLAALGDEAVDRPGVDELARTLGLARHLGVALGDVDRLHAQVAEQPRPACAVGRLRMRQAGVAGDDQRRLLDQLRDQARVGALGADRGRTAARARGAAAAAARAARSWSARPATGCGRNRRRPTAR